MRLDTDADADKDLPGAVHRPSGRLLSFQVGFRLVGLHHTQLAGLVVGGLDVVGVGRRGRRTVRVHGEDVHGLSSCVT